jgi:hypothetical protein
MARDFDNTDDISEMTDDELHRLVRDRFDSEQALDPDDLVVTVRDGHVTVAGRVGTEVELRIADHVLSDGIGLTDYDSQLVVDPIRRAESPEAIDEHLVDEAEHEGRLLGDRSVPLSPEAEHREENLNAHMFGTADVQESIEEAAPWIPPEGPTPEGLGETDAGPETRSEDH